MAKTGDLKRWMPVPCARHINRRGYWTGRVRLPWLEFKSWEYLPWLEFEEVDR